MTFLLLLLMLGAEPGAAKVRSGRMLQDGRETFRVGCIRCHGEDGNLDTYFGIKKLGGIGKRLSREEIKLRLHPMPLGKSDVTVRGHVVSKERLDSLIAYVASL